MTTDLKTRLEQAAKRRDDLLNQQQRVLGRLEEAQRSVDELKSRCRAKNVDPDKLDETIARLETELEKNVVTLEDQLAQAEKSLEPFANRK